MTRKQPRRPRHVPQRTCVVCREKKDKRQLIRLVRTVDEGVVVDTTGKRNGRGAYLCQQASCWDKALADSRLLARVLKTEISAEERAQIGRHKPSSKQVVSD